MAEKRFYELCRGIFLSLQILSHLAFTRKRLAVNSIDALDTADTQVSNLDDGTIFMG